MEYAVFCISVLYSSAKVTCYIRIAVLRKVSFLISSEPYQSKCRPNQSKCRISLFVIFVGYHFDIDSSQVIPVECLRNTYKNTLLINVNLKSISILVCSKNKALTTMEIFFVPKLILYVRFRKIDRKLLFW